MLITILIIINSNSDSVSSCDRKCNSNCDINDNGESTINVNRSNNSNDVTSSVIFAAI